jgi:hypothetical protein
MFLISWLLPLAILMPLMILLAINIEIEDFISAYFVGLILATYITKLDRFLQMKAFSFKSILRNLSPFDEGRGLWENYFAVMIASAIIVLIISYAFKIFYFKPMLIAYIAYGVILFVFAKLTVLTDDSRTKEKSSAVKVKKSTAAKTKKATTKTK